MSSVKIAVRVRPFNSREKDRDAVTIIKMQGKSTSISHPDKLFDKNSTRTFTFDYSYWSMDSSQPQFSSQDHVYRDMGRDMLNHAFDGYNTCIFAYGQTGSGKSYSMLGAPGTDQRGIIPRSCEELFERIEQNTDETHNFRVEVSLLAKIMIICEFQFSLFLLGELF